jgi:hypothetical protein
MFLRVYPGPALNRGTILLDDCYPICEPLSKRFAFLDLGCHGLLWAKGHATGLRRAVELGVRTGRDPKNKELTIEIAFVGTVPQLRVS